MQRSVTKQIEIEEIEPPVITSGGYRDVLAEALRDNRSAADIHNIIQEWYKVSSTMGTSEATVLVDLNAEDAITGRTPLQEAVFRGQRDTVRLLLHYPDVDVDAPTPQGATAAYMTIPDRCDILPLLMSAGSSPVEGWRRGKSPLERAVETESIECLSDLYRVSPFILHPNEAPDEGAEELLNMAWEPETQSSASHKGYTEFKARVMEKASKIATLDKRLPIIRYLHALHFDSFAVGFTWCVLEAVTFFTALFLPLLCLYHLVVWGPLDSRRPLEVSSMLGIGDPLKTQMGSSGALLPESAPPTARLKCRGILSTTEEIDVEACGRFDIDCFSRVISMKNACWLSVFVKVPSMYVSVGGLDDFFSPEETLQERLKIIDRRRLILRIVHYTELVVRWSALLAVVIWMAYVTDRPILAVTLMSVGGLRVGTSLLFTAQAKESHLLAVFGQGAHKVIETRMRALMRTAIEDEPAGGATTGEKIMRWLLKFYCRGYFSPRRSSLLVPLATVLVISIAAVTFTTHGQWLYYGMFPTIYNPAVPPVEVFGRAGSLERYFAVWMEALFIIVTTEMLFGICVYAIVAIAILEGRLDGQRYLMESSHYVGSNPGEGQHFQKRCASAVNQVSIDQWRLLRQPLMYLYSFYIVTLFLGAGIDILLLLKQLPVGLNYIGNVATIFVWWSLPLAIGLLWVAFLAARSNSVSKSMDQLQFTLPCFRAIEWPTAVFSLLLTICTYGLELYLFTLTTVKEDTAPL
ncbi:hypothetical protein FOL47_005101 [Perkinsus chesapeaki]|uniref:Uncharacterized protein n=1 Tax=Perkinsus chesapeaki TaxID=330153 RepID=A0A7J6LZU9_PERCH|nr:hypothetical protein FOL47_005101 [Perkinsus chesapeaki]